MTVVVMIVVVVVVVVGVVGDADVFFVGVSVVCVVGVVVVTPHMASWAPTHCLARC